MGGIASGDAGCSLHVKSLVHVRCLALVGASLVRGCHGAQRIGFSAAVAALESGFEHTFVVRHRQPAIIAGVQIKISKLLSVCEIS